MYDEDPMLLQTTGTAPIQFVLPAKYTHVKIQRGSSEGNGFARWHLDRVAIDDLRPLRGRVTGTGGEVLAWRGEERSIRFDFPAYKHGHRSLEFFSFENGERISMDREGSTRGTAVIPGPGFIRIQAVQGWKIEAD
ncbi:hypothetical protein AB0O01_35505 [Streptomyces sp. NPDC093252]|uniref:hypothetical protein n=1 Tax=Streptomyces sp. NPDC093252 TaxID=3154980 RepID=UPI003412781F